MIKDLNRVFEDINGIYGNIQYKLNTAQTNKDTLYFTTQIESQFFKGVALLTGIVDDSGVIRLIATFGEIEETPEVMAAINKFNFYAAWAKAYIGELNGKKLLEVRYSNCLEIDDPQAPVLFKFFFDDLTSDDLVTYLTPMVALTK